MKTLATRVGVVLLGLTCCVGPVRASELELTAGVLTFASFIAVDNVLTISQLGGTYTIDDPHEAMNLGTNAAAAGCAPVDTDTVACPVAAITSFDIRPGPNEDLVLLTGITAPARVDGGFSSDTILGGGGDDTFVWNPGGGNDSIDGGPGMDTLDFNGSGASEVIKITADGPGFDIVRQIGAAQLDVDGVEELNLVTQGGIDDVSTTTLLHTTQHLTAGPDTGVAADTLHVDAAGVCLLDDGDTFWVEGRPPIMFHEFDTVLVENLFCRADPCDGAVPSLGCTVNGVRDQPCRGTDGDDIIAGTAASDVIVGAGGNDRIRGGAGDDLLCGEAGDDTLIGARGNDTLVGGPGLDKLRGDSGNDTLVGGADADDVKGGGGDDELDGGLGDDRLRAGAGNDTLQGGDGIDLVDGASGTDTCSDSDQTALFLRCE